MKIRVTEEHIKNGVPNNCYCCPVALAINDAIPDAVAFVGHVCGIRFNLNDKREYDYVSEEVMNFIGAFDAGRKVEPFSFDLDTSSNPLAFYED